MVRRLVPDTAERDGGGQVRGSSFTMMPTENDQRRRRPGRGYPGAAGVGSPSAAIAVTHGEEGVLDDDLVELEAGDVRLGLR